MNILLINVPSRRGKGGFTLPLGLIYVGAIIERSGHNAKIYDPYLDDVELRDLDNNFDTLDKIIEYYKPSIIGFGGIATSYGRTKKLSFHIKNKYPEIFQIVGGALSSTYELLLTRTKIDVVFHGETEISLPKLLTKYEQNEPYYDIEGISFFLNGKIIKNPSVEQIRDLDTIPLPSYHLIDLRQYLVNINDWINQYNILHDNNYVEILKKINGNKNYIPIVTSRGCTHKCLFCYRHVRGIRQHSVSYVVRHLKYLKQIYGIEGFQFCDELFNSNPEWVLKYCNAIDRENLNIFYLISGARVDKISEVMLNRLRETGCIEINYGQESGSDTILKEYNKGVSSEKNKEITLLTKRKGIHCPVQIVIGSPSEITNTIYETVQFLKDVDAYQYSLNYLIPLPETQIWKYVENNQLINDVEQYLDLVSEHGGNSLINLTEVSEREWRNWKYHIMKEMKLYYYKKKKRMLYYFFYFLFNTISISILYRFSKYIPVRLKKIIKKLLW